MKQELNSKYIEKNILDLRYQEHLQKLNAILIFMSVGALSFFGTFIWNIELLGVGIIISIIILVSGFLIYSKIKNSMDDILTDIKKIK